MSTESDEVVIKELSFWVKLFALFSIIYSASLLWVLYVGISENPAKLYGPFYIFVGAMSFYQITAYFGLLYEKNWARKMVLCLAYIKLIVVPIGTVEGIVMLRNLKGRQFK